VVEVESEKNSSLGGQVGGLAAGMDERRLCEFLCCGRREDWGKAKVISFSFL